MHKSISQKSLLPFINNNNKNFHNTDGKNKTNNSINLDPLITNKKIYTVTSYHDTLESTDSKKNALEANISLNK